MSNPIVVFFDRSRAAEAGWTWPEGVDDLPLGCIKDGSSTKLANPGQVAGEYEVLILDDRQIVAKQLADSQHTNKHLDQPLLVVTHNNSALNDAPDKDGTLKSWGLVFPSIDQFSHVRDDQIFKKICKLLEGNGDSASDFAKWFRKADELEFLEKLAALRQIEKLGVNDGINDLERIYLIHFPMEFRNNYEDSDADKAFVDIIKRANSVSAS